jgi:hypothetical protein
LVSPGTRFVAVDANKAVPTVVRDRDAEAAAFAWCSLDERLMRWITPVAPSMTKTSRLRSVSWLTSSLDRLVKST